jgi:hypothetical protein
MLLCTLLPTIPFLACMKHPQSRTLIQLIDYKCHCSTLKQAYATTANPWQTLPALSFQFLTTNSGTAVKTRMSASQHKIWREGTPSWLTILYSYPQAERKLLPKVKPDGLLCTSLHPFEHSFTHQCNSHISATASYKSIDNLKQQEGPH